VREPCLPSWPAWRRGRGFPMSDANAKREANLAAKEAAKKEQNAQIAAGKKAKAAEREAANKQQQQQESAKAAQQAEAGKQRDAKVATREQQKKEEQEARTKARKAKEASSKYSKKDVLDLKKVFDDYDADRSGKVSLDEWTRGLENKKKKNAIPAGQRSTLEQRKAQEGTSILDISESVFHEVDKDGDGDITFRELLKLMFSFATPEEIATMLSWVAPDPEPEPPPKPTLSPANLNQIKKLFKQYDKNKDGSVNMSELKTGLKKLGVDIAEDLDRWMKDFDADGNQQLDETEFIAFMESTEAFYD